MHYNILTVDKAKFKQNKYSLGKYFVFIYTGLLGLGNILHKNFYMMHSKLVKSCLKKHFSHS